MQKKLTLPIIIIAVILLALFLVLPLFYPTTSPLNSILYFFERLAHPHKNLNKELVGFLPYWKLDNMRYVHLDSISEVNYFSLYAGKDGHIVKTINNETEPGWREWNNQVVKDYIAKTQIMGAKYSVTIAVHKNDDIESILRNKSYRENFISDIVQEVKSRHLDGVNLDFEYQGEPDEKDKDNFTILAQDLNNTLQSQSPLAQLSLSVMPLSARENDLFDFPKLVPFFDKFIGMSYDFYGTTSEIAGPVAPMKGYKENKYFFDVITMYEDLGKFIPKNKIIMGIPYYGWDWAVEDGKTIQSKTYPQDDPKNYSAVLSYGRMKEMKELKPNQCSWDDYALATWCWYTDKEKTGHQVWLEDEKSITLKYDFAKQQNFAGTAIWVLGYDKDYPDLWNLIQTKFISK